MSYTVKEVGKPDTLEYRVYLLHDNKPVSPFHDVPLWADKEKGIANMVVEIPKGTQPKLEINKDEFMNPIKQDVKNGKLRIVAYKYPFNYGALPQTWESPNVVHPDTKAKGDNDPIDVCEISSGVLKTGEIKKVKVLGTYAMIDEGETDWKVLAIDVNDPMASKLNEHDDIEKHIPGKLNEVFTFLRDYKIPDGKPANTFAFNGELKNKKFAMDVIEETNAQWKKLSQPAISIFNTTQEKAPGYVTQEQAHKRLGW